MHCTPPRKQAAILVTAAVLAAGPLAAPARAQGAGQPAAAAPDVQFVSGMILHHAQAVLMAGWAPTHGASPAVRELCERIAISQRDEMATMERWLRAHDLALPDTSPSASLAPSSSMPGMAMGPGASGLMPGMLTPPQLAQLDSARGPAFDRAFLTFMIQHHRGALTMVADYENAPSAGEDPWVFQFASDVNGDQSAEIDRMSRMLAAMNPVSRSQ